MDTERTQCLLQRRVSQSRGNGKSVRTPNAKLKQMLDSFEELKLLQTYEASITNLLALGFDRHQIKEFLTKENRTTTTEAD